MRYHLTVKIMHSRASGAVNKPETIGKVKNINYDTHIALRAGDIIEETVKVSDWNPILVNKCEIIDIISVE